ncbi:MAG: DAK2 domain-containing protein [Herpetosiphon sp.]
MTGHGLKTCDGIQLLAALRAGSAWLEQHVGDINALNVFPVPDGDTGTNMNLTFTAALMGIGDLTSVAAVCSTIEKQALRAARGNSGVILSQILRGFSDGLADGTVLDGPLLAQAFSRAAERAYKAVMKPTEGTMLTVIRVAGEDAQRAASDGADLEAVVAAAVTGARRAVADTPNLLKQLRDAGVVDAGGEGVAVILEGVLRHLRCESVVRSDAPVAVAAVVFEDLHGTDDFGYCTTFLLEGAGIPFDDVRSTIGEMGSSAVVVGDDTTVKIHVHTLRPGDVLNFAMGYGSLTQVEIANMDAQRAQIHASGSVAAIVGRAPKEASMAGHGLATTNGAAEAPIGVVAVAAGAGWEKIFRSASVGEVVTGGQTMNPSTADLAAAIERIPQQNVIVLPNNSNILMAARLAQELVEKHVEIIPTRTLPQGVAAILALNFSYELDQNVQAMTRAIQSVRTIEITTAVRDAVVNDTEVHMGQTIGLLDDALVAAGDDRDAIIDEALAKVDLDDYEVVTIYRGASVNDALGQALAQRLKQSYPHLEQVDVQVGGQPFYDFVISIE